MEEKTTLIGSGKIRFTSSEHANEVQRILLDNGYRFFCGKQEPRECYGVMWREKEIRSAANQHAFKAYGVPVVESPVEVRKVTTLPKRIYTPEERQAQTKKAGQKHRDDVEGRVISLMRVVTVALKNISQYEPNLYGTNSRSQARIRAWDKLYAECVSVHGEIPQEGTLRTAIRRVLIEKGKPFMVPDSRRTTRAMKSAQ